MEKRYALLRNAGWLAMFLLALSLSVFAKVLRPVLSSRIEQIPAGSAYDFLLDALPVISANWIIVLYWAIPISLLVLAIGAKIYYNLEDLPYFGLVCAFGMILTDVFFTVTVLGPPHNFVNSWFVLDFNKDLFPSMHIGSIWLWFLMADKKWVKTILLVGLIVVSAIVLLMHTHYTIDVLGAIFIFYALFALCEKYLKPLLRNAYEFSKL